MWTSAQHSFLGLASYYRKFVKDFTEVANPLVELTRKEWSFVLSAECDIAFGKLRNTLVRPPILKYPTLRSPFQL